MPYQKILSAGALREDECVGVEIDGLPIAIVRSAGKLYAIGNRCTHNGSRLDTGRIGNGQITCPLHGARFDLASGKCVNLRRHCAPLLTLPVVEQDGMINVFLPERNAL